MAQVTTRETRETVLQELEGLAEDRIPEVLDFIRFLKSRSEEERIILIDEVDYRILRSAAAYRTLPPRSSPLRDPNVEPAGLSEEDLEQEETGEAFQTRWDQTIAAYLDGHINLGRAAVLLGLSVYDLKERFLRLGIPLRLGPETVEDARAEVAVSLSLKAG